MSDFDVFKQTPGGMINLPEMVKRDREAREAAQAALLAALGHPAGRAWLDARTAAEWARPSFVPGDNHADTAFREGRKSILREIAEQLHAASQPTPTGE